jgi:hypothetical protein
LNYLIGFASSLSVLIIDKLTSNGLSIGSIKRFKLSEGIRNYLAIEYNIHPDSLFLEKHSKDESGIEKVSFRNIAYRFHLTIKDNELIDLKTESLNKYI